jgi:hypothetical protein
VRERKLGRPDPSQKGEGPGDDKVGILKDCSYAKLSVIAE